MNVRLFASIQGTRDGQPWPARGEVVNLPDAEAQDMLDHGQAVLPDVPLPTGWDVTTPRRVAPPYPAAPVVGVPDDDMAPGGA